MARDKTQKPLTEDPPEPDSSDEETSSSTEAEEEDQEQEQEQDEEEDDSSSSDDEIPVTPPPPPATAPSSAKKTLTAVTTTATTKKPPADESSDDDEPPVAMLKAVKPTVDASPSKPRSKVVAALSSGKRPLETEGKGSSKKSRKEKGKETSGNGPLVVAAQEEGSSKKLFQRIFSEDDEIEILKGMLELKAKKGADPMNDVDGFYEFIKKSVNADVNKGQIVDKIRRLKKKFFNAKKKKLSNPHDLRSFLLSKKIWGMDEDEDGDEKIGNGVIQNNSSAVKLNSKAGNLKSKVGNGGVLDNSKDKEEGEEGKDDNTKGLDEKKGGFECGEFVEIEELRQEGLRKMGAKARAELKEMWRKVVNAEMEVKLMRDEAQAEETRKILEALRSGKP